MDWLFSPEVFPPAIAGLTFLFLVLRWIARRGVITAGAFDRIALPGARDEVARLLEFVQNPPSRELLVSSMRALAERRAVAAVEPIAAYLDVDDTEVASEAASALGEIGDTRGLDLLLEASHRLEAELSGSPELVQVADPVHPVAEARDSSGERTPADRIVPPLARNNYRVFDKYTPHDVSEQSEDEIVRLLLAVAENASEPVNLRYFALKNLESFERLEIVPLLVELLQDEHPTLRYTAAEVMAVHGDESCVDPLLESLSDPNRFVRSSSAMTLAVLGSERAIPVLVRLRHDPDDVVRYSVAKALETLGRRKSIRGLLSIHDR